MDIYLMDIMDIYFVNPKIPTPINPLTKSTTFQGLQKVQNSKHSLASPIYTSSSAYLICSTIIPCVQACYKKKELNQIFSLYITTYMGWNSSMKESKLS